MRHRRRRHDQPDFAPRIERGERILEDHLDARALTAQFLALHRGQIDVAEPDLPGIGLDDARHETRNGRLAGSGLADEPERLALVDLEAHVVDGLDEAIVAEHAGFRPEGLVQPRDRAGDGIVVDGFAFGRRTGWYGGEQRDRVGMFGAAQDLFGRAGFDYVALLQNQDVVGDVGNDAEIVGDEDHRRLAPLLNVSYQVQDLRLGGHVQCRGRFVGDEQFRLQSQRHRDHRSLPLPAGKLVRIGTHDAFGIGQPDFPGQVENLALTSGPRQHVVRLEDLSDLVADAHGRVQRRHRLLEDHADRLAAHAAHRPLVDLEKIVPLKQDFAALDMNDRRQKSHQGLGAERLA